ncbi:MAG: non-canonical purine NTP pyrophosphatase [Microgenomates group bacterium]
MPNAIVYATTNPGKLAMVQNIFAHHNLKLQSLADYNINVDIDEVGTSLEENAKLKAEGYSKYLPTDSIVIADDTGIEIDALGGEPGIKVRRWKGYKMTDEEIIEYCLLRMKDVPNGKRGAQFRTVLAVSKHNSPVKYFDGVLKGEILQQPQSLRSEGMPFWPIFYIPKLKMSLGEFHQQSIEFQLAHPTHRERAVLAALMGGL